MASKKRSRRTLWLLLAIPVVPLLLVVFFVAVVLEVLYPEPADEELRQRPRRELAVRTTPPPTRTANSCSLKVRALEGLAPVADAEVVVRPRYFELARWEVRATTAATGEVFFEDLPCARVDIESAHDDLAGPGLRSTRLIRLDDNLMLVQFARPIEVHGKVTGPNGEPVVDARVVVQDQGELSATTDSRGRYVLDVPLDPDYAHLLAMEADGLGYTSGNRLVRLQPSDITTFQNHSNMVDQDVVDVRPGDRIEVNFSLSAANEVRVWCAGLPGDRCNDMLVHCTHPLMPMGETCHQNGRTGETICQCPDGDQQAIRGGGKATLVDVGEREAWLDFRDTGSMTGQVLTDGLPAGECDAIALRVPNGLEDIPRGFIAAHKTRCDDAGRFELDGLIDGDWTLVVEATVPDIGHRQRTMAPARVRPRRNTDVGDIEMLGGGTIKGTVVDGMTGQAETSGGVLAIRRGQGQERTTPTVGDTDQSGHFTLEGLPPGEWELCHVLSPHVRTYVTVEDGAITDGVIVETSDATALDTNGFTLVRQGSRLIVQEVELNSPAEAAGLTPGDEVTGLLIAGLDLGEKLGDDADKLLQLVLGHWDGPGITLLVERDGEEYEVELDW